ncbi:hypothetical protein [Nocardia testacea]|uniref:hypothetical protein n=1 Tax=Nocardia testacea TaxID=248551 RepID=UPI0012F6FF41|nr:hypothetical protein [Nocardia testacea]
MDFAKLPTGDRGWRQFVDMVSTIDDREERHYLELKSDIGPASRSGGAKVAKFILGAANRSPSKAVKYFGGHALLVVGVSKGAVTGIRFPEVKDLEKRVFDYTRLPGPSWDFKRIPVDGTDRDVIVIIVDPPKDGDPLWVCYREHSEEGLRNGGVYIRGDGETRLATGDEIGELCRRMIGGGSPKADIELGINAKVYRYGCDESLVDEYIAAVRSRVTPGPSNPYRLAEVIFGDTRTWVDFQKELQEWESETREEWPDVVAAAVGALGLPPKIQLHNKSKDYLKHPRIGALIKGLHLWAVDAVDKDDFDPYGILPKPPDPWGARGIARVGSSYGLNIFSPSVPKRAGHGELDWRILETEEGWEDGGVGFTGSLPELRSEELSLSFAADFVLITNSSDLTEVHGKWRVTFAEHNHVYGPTDFTAEVVEVDVTPLLRTFLIERPAAEVDADFER